MKATFFMIILVIACFGCKEVIIPKFYHPTSAYDAYRHGLVKSGLGNSLLVKKWLETGQNCLQDPTYVKLPYQEILIFDEIVPAANTYRLKTRYGQRIEAQLESIDTSDARIFIDLFRVWVEDSTEVNRHVATADTITNTVGFEPRLDGEYILRLHPELFAAGRYQLVIKEVPTFTFPVANKTESAILSVFGDPRDAGRRKHEGVDIFSRRHTPIIASASGVVRYAGERGLGGKQAWIRDRKRDLSLYFAHLDSVYVRRGDRVQAGDTIGTNGNSGNARTTNPHLHFGVYGDTGAIDPYHFIVPNRKPLRKIRSNIAWTGQWVRTKNKAFFDQINGRYRTQRDLLPIHQIMKVEAAWSRSYRVELPDGRVGYVRSGDLALAEPLKNKKSTDTQYITRDIAGHIVLDSIPPESKYIVLGKHRDAEYVAFGNAQGWVSP